LVDQFFKSIQSEAFQTGDVVVREKKYFFYFSLQNPTDNTGYMPLKRLIHKTVKQDS
jgi:hypothetical protein